MRQVYATAICAAPSQPRERGLSLIELLVAITIGAVLIFGATQVYVDSRKTYEINETMARLQETARFALAVIEPDVRMANYWGLLKGAGLIGGQAAQDAASIGAPDECGANFARDLVANIEGSNNAYGFDCDEIVLGAAGDGFSNAAVGSADTLTIRRAATAVAALESGRLQICSTRVMGQLIDDGSACTAAPAGRVSDLVVNAYYVHRDSVDRPGLPSLRRHTLTTQDVGGVTTPDFRDDEIIPGVEDLQVQFGIDPTGVMGVATRYVNAEDAAALGATEQIVAVRIWLLVRSETPEVGFIDGATYEYGDRDEDNGTTDDLSAAGAATQAYEPEDGFRRLLVSRTIQIRNAIGT